MRKRRRGEGRKEINKNWEGGKEGDFVLHLLPSNPNFLNSKHYGEREGYTKRFGEREGIGHLVLAIYQNLVPLFYYKGIGIEGERERDIEGGGKDGKLVFLFLLCLSLLLTRESPSFTSKH